MSASLVWIFKHHRGRLRFLKGIFRKSEFLYKDSYLSDHLSIYWNMLVIIVKIGLHVWIALYWYGLLIYWLHHIYFAVLAPMIYVFIIFCIILYYWIWLVVRRLFIRVKSIIEIEIGNYSKSRVLYWLLRILS